MIGTIFRFALKLIPFIVGGTTALMTLGTKNVLSVMEKDSNRILQVLEKSDVHNVMASKSFLRTEDMADTKLKHYKNNPVDFIRDYETGELQKIQPHTKKLLEVLNSRSTVSLHPRKMIMVTNPI